MQTAPHAPSLKTLSEGDEYPGSGPMVPPALVVSIHDVSTVTRPMVDLILGDLAAVGVPITSLLVIPDHHHKGRVDADLEFSAWLRREVAEGHEPVLHGLYHLRPFKTGEGLATRFVTRSYTDGEGEFYDLTFGEASALLRRGREVLEACGIEPTGFIAPAWLLGVEAETAVRSEGFAYTTRITEVLDFRQGTHYAARSMVYSVRAGWRRSMSLLWNEMLFRALQGAPLLRIGLHPPDWEHEEIRRHILACIRSAAIVRRVTTYREWLDQASSSRQ